MNATFLETFVILSAILLRIKTPVACAIFSIAFFEAVFIVSVVDFLALSRSFYLYIWRMFLAKDKNPYTVTYALYLSDQLNNAFL